MEAQHRNKINAEINRYQAMVQEKEELSRKWDEEVCLCSYGGAKVHKWLTSRIGPCRMQTVPLLLLLYAYSLTMHPSTAMPLYFSLPGIDHPSAIGHRPSVVRCVYLSYPSGHQNQKLVDAHTEALQKVIEEYDKKVKYFYRISTQCRLVPSNW